MTHTVNGSITLTSMTSVVDYLTITTQDTGIAHYIILLCILASDVSNVYKCGCSDADEDIDLTNIADEDKRKKHLRMRMWIRMSDGHILMDADTDYIIHYESLKTECGHSFRAVWTCTEY